MAIREISVQSKLVLLMLPLLLLFVINQLLLVLHGGTGFSQGGASTRIRDGSDSLILRSTHHGGMGKRVRGRRRRGGLLVLPFLLSLSLLFWLLLLKHNAIFVFLLLFSLNGRRSSLGLRTPWGQLAGRFGIPWRTRPVRRGPVRLERSLLA